MKTVVLTTVALALVAMAGGAAVVYAGLFNVAADDPHSPLVNDVLYTVRRRSIAAHAVGIAVPPEHDDTAALAMATGHFAEHCALCHGAPGIAANEIAAGMYPKPPSLIEVSRRYTPAELFWIIRHGIKMSAMPAMGDDGDAMLWATVALLERLPTMTPAAFKALQAAAPAGEAAGMDMNTMDTKAAGGTAAKPDAR